MSENRLSREIKNLVRPTLLMLDEASYLALDATQASLLFQVIAGRYEKQQPIVVTSNKAFADWGDVFAGDTIMASAALDRLLHRSTVIHIRGDSYRLKEKRKAGHSAVGPLPDHKKEDSPMNAP
jgi:DNA replication protein DnaC